MFDGNPDFFNQLNIEQEQIYKNKSLNAYTNNDPISIKQSELIRIDIEKKQLLLELKILREDKMIDKLKDNLASVAALIAAGCNWWWVC